jgi:hypothetical protein
MLVRGALPSSLHLSEDLGLLLDLEAGLQQHEMSEIFGRLLVLGVGPHLREMSEEFGQLMVQKALPSGLHLRESSRALRPLQLGQPSALSGCGSDQRWNATAFWMADVDWYSASAIRSLLLLCFSVSTFLCHLGD